MRAVEPEEGVFGLLRKFVYDEPALAGYTATLEGGLIAETKTTSGKKGSKGGKLNFKFAEADLSRDDETNHSWTLSDHPHAQFERLLDAANEDPETIGWIDVMDPNADFAEAAIGNFISWECDAYVPAVFQVLAATGDAGRNLKLAEGMLGTMKKAVEAAKAGAGAEGVDEHVEKATAMEMKLDAVKHILSRVQSPRKIVGEDPDVTQWKVFGRLDDEHMRVEEIDDRLIVVGKVERILPPGKWQPLVDTPFLDYPNRAERKKRQRETAPEPGKEEHFVQGPALLMDVLAVYR